MHFIEAFFYTAVLCIYQSGSQEI